MKATTHVEINRLHATVTQHEPEIDHTDLRLRLGHLLNSADLHPLTIPPSAILIVKELADPLPGRFGYSQDGTRINADWEQCVREALTNLYHQAMKPVGSVISPNNSSILFADEGEMLAYLVLEMSQGNASEQWWWEKIFRTLPVPSMESLTTLFCSHALYIPAILHHLTEWNQISTVMNALSSEQLLSILSTVMAAYGLPDLNSTLVPGDAVSNSHAKFPARVNPSQGKSAVLLNLLPSDRNHETHELQAHVFKENTIKPKTSPEQPYNTVTSNQATNAPWKSLRVAALLPGFQEKEKTCLVGIGLSLYYEPAKVQTRAFLEALRNWWNVQTTSSSAKKKMSPIHTQLPTPGGGGKTKNSFRSEDTGHVLSSAIQAGRHGEDRSSKKRPTQSWNDYESKPTQDRTSPVNQEKLITRLAPRGFPPYNPQSLPHEQEVHTTTTQGCDNVIPPNRLPQRDPTNSPSDLPLPQGKASRKATQNENERFDFKESSAAPNPAREPSERVFATEEQAKDLPDETTALPFFSMQPRKKTGALEVLTKFVGTNPIGVSSYQERSLKLEDDATPQMTDHCISCPFEEGSETQLGGILYLINVMQQLDLPACFEEEWNLASHVGSWGILEILGRGLLENNDEHLVTDPIWQALAQLDGRKQGELPGERFHGNTRFCLPRSWWVQVGTGKDEEFHWATDNQRLCLWSAQGYPLLDVPRNTLTPFAQIHEELSVYKRDAAAPTCLRNTWSEMPFNLLPNLFTQHINSNLRHWLIMALPYIRFRIRQAFDPLTSTKLSLAETVLRVQGRLYVTSTHVDLVMKPDAASLPLRLAGLDCNPGWLPEFSRVVQFHFT